MDVVPPPPGDTYHHMRVNVVKASSYRPIPGSNPCRPLVTFRVRMPRTLLVELNTHGLLNVSSESSRAVPFGIRSKATASTPWVPRFRKKKPGMQAGDPFAGSDARLAEEFHFKALKSMLEWSEAIDGVGAAKEYANRYLEPFAFITLVLTGSRWDNFFALRAHPDADPAFEFFAKAVYLAYRKATKSNGVSVIERDHWHTPFVDPVDEWDAASKCVSKYGVPKWFGVAGPTSPEWFHLCRWSASRCARTSYNVFGGGVDHDKDDRTYAKLVGLGDDVTGACRGVTGFVAGWPKNPIHANTLSHQGLPAVRENHMFYKSNLDGWVQFRKLFPNESCEQFDPPADVVSAWENDVPSCVFEDF